MGDYIITKTKSNIVFYTTRNHAFFSNSYVTYEVVYVDQGKNGYRFASIRKIVKQIEAGQVQCLNDLASIMKPDVTWQYTQRRPWLQEAEPNQPMELASI